MHKIKILSILGIFFLMNCSIAQNTSTSSDYTTKKTVSGKAKKYFDKGMEYTRASNNEKAIKEFNKALKATPNLIDAHIQIAAAYYDMESFAKAEENFEKAIAIDQKYKSKVLYVTGIAEMKQDKYKEAIGHFDQFIALEKKNEKLLAKAKKYRATSAFTMEAFSHPVPFEPASLGDKINTPNPEYLPTITADESVLIYTVNIRGQEDFYMSKKVDGEWQKGEPMDEINTELNEGAQSISADGKLLVFTACGRRDGYGSCDLYFSEVINGRWTKVANMGKQINSRAKETQPSLSADGRTIYFSSDRAGGQGSMDIWFSTRDEEGKWGIPQNLGEVINTNGLDRTPFIHPDGQTLYFMSDGHPGLGGYDLFFSRLENGEWTAPKNMGYPINTEADEATLVISLDGKTAYLATDRNKMQNVENKIHNGKVDLDLFQFELYEAARPKPVTYVKAKVRDAATRKKLAGAKVEFTDLSTEKVHAFSKTDADGEFLVCLPLGKNYSLNVTKPEYLFHSENFELQETSSLEEPFILEIDLQAVPIATAVSEGSGGSLKESKPIILKNVFFETGSADLKNTSLLELNRLKNLLNDHSNLKIRVNGHTDNVGSEEDNLKLSNNRAKAVYDYLVANGISSDRLSYKGFGETEPIADNETPENRRLNRRTEFVVVK
ncbi:MAG: OmpA family protein [Saprospiraceae bacterium]